MEILRTLTAIFIISSTISVKSTFARCDWTGCLSQELPSYCGGGIVARRFQAQGCGSGFVNVYCCTGGDEGVGPNLDQNQFPGGLQQGQGGFQQHGAGGFQSGQGFQQGQGGLQPDQGFQQQGQGGFQQQGQGGFQQQGQGGFPQQGQGIQQGQMGQGGFQSGQMSQGVMTGGQQSQFGGLQGQQSQFGGLQGQQSQFGGSQDQFGGLQGQQSQFGGQQSQFGGQIDQGQNFGQQGMYGQQQGMGSPGQLVSPPNSGNLVTPGQGQMDHLVTPNY